MDMSIFDGHDVIADNGEYIVASMPERQRCSYGVWGCKICTVVIRRAPSGELSVDEWTSDGWLCEKLTTEDELTIESIIVSAERLKKRDADYAALIEMLKEEPQQQPQPQQHHVLDICEMQIAERR